MLIIDGFFDDIYELWMDSDVFGNQFSSERKKGGTQRLISRSRISQLLLLTPSPSLFSHLDPWGHVI